MKYFIYIDGEKVRELDDAKHVEKCTTDEERKATRFAMRKWACEVQNAVFQKSTGQQIILKNENGKILKNAKKIYADDDPRWNAVPLPEECKTLFLAVVRQAVFDSTLGEAFYGTPVADAPTRNEQHRAKHWFTTQNFAEYAQLCGFEPEWTLGQINKTVRDCHG